MNAKRIIAFALSICMMLTVASFPVMAEEAPYEQIALKPAPIEDVFYEVSAEISEDAEFLEADAISNSYTLQEAQSMDIKFEDIDTSNGIVVLDTNGFLVVGNVVVGDTFVAFEVTAPAGTGGNLAHVVIADATAERTVLAEFVVKITEILITEDGLRYSIENSQVTITGYAGTATEVVIPSTIDGYPVTKIGDEAFEYCSFLVSATISDGVTSIGEYAFAYCSSLASVAIPESVNQIGYAAFRNCSSLTSIVIPNSVTDISDYAFFYCSAVESVILPDSLKTIGYRAFSHCGSLESIIIPDGATTIGNSAFEYCYELANITIPNSVKVIDDSAFYYCKKLATITIPESVESIGNYAFYGCESLAEIKVEQNNTEYCSDNGVLFNKEKTVLVVYPAGKNNTTYTIPDSVTSINRWAFSACQYLTEIYVSANNTNYSSENGVLFNKAKTRLVQYPTGKKDSTYTIPNSVEYIGDSAFERNESLTSVTIPDSVCYIEQFAFYGCISITSIVIPEKVSYIDNYVFYNCASLTSITIPDRVNSIGNYAFAYCYGLTSFIFPEIANHIGNYAFYYCYRLASITIPESMNYIGRYAFERSGLNSVYYNGTEERKNAIDFTYGNDLLLNATWHYAYCEENGHTYDNNSDLVCNVCGKQRGPSPVSDFEYTIDGNYATITKYNGSASVVEIPEKIDGCYVEIIGEDAFKNCTSLVEIIIPLAGTIGDNAFSGCTSLRDVYYQGTNFNWVTVGAGNECLTNATIHHHDMEGGMGGIGFDMHKMDRGYTDNCDEECNICKYRREAPHTYDGDADLVCDGCGNVREAPVATFDYTIENGEVTITDYTGNATEVVIPSTIEGYPVTAIGDSAFFYCRDVISIAIPNSVKTIGAGAFDLCTSLTSIIIPEGVTSIGNGTFQECSKLAAVTLPKSLTNVGDYAFNGCYKLSTVYYGGTETQKSAITVGTQNDCLLSATWHCTSVETPITDFEYTIRNGEVHVTGYIGTAAVVKIPATIEGYPVTQIGPFRDCPTIESITIPESVTGNSGPFLYESLSLVEINVDPNNEFLCSENGILFSKDKGRIIKYPSGKKDTSYNIPEGVSIIDSYAFSHCDSLATVVFPESVGQLRLFAFEGFTSLEEIVVSPDNDNFCSQDGVLFNKDKTTLIHYPRSKSGATYIVPEGVKEIGEDAFSICQNLTTVTISQSVTTIGKDAFDSCSSLDSVTLPNSVNSIGAFAFWGCHNLSNVYYNGTEIQKNAIAVEENNDCLFNATWHYVSFANPATDFEYTISNGEVTIDKYIGSATEVIIPSTIEGCHVVEIGKEAFLNCSSLTSIDVLPDNNRFSSEGGVLFDKDKTELVAYPIGKQDVTYTVPDGVKIIDASAFEFAINLTSITLPNSITTIRTAAFAHSVIMNVLYNGTKEQKANIAIAEQNEYLVDATWHYFDGFCDSTCGDCDFVREAPDHTYDTVYDAVCNECGFERVAVPEGIKYTVSNGEVTITDYNGSATTLVVPSTIEGYPVTSIGSHAFADCNSFVSVIIPDSVTSIGNSAFWDCKSLKSIIIPDNVTSIGTYVFFRNSALESATIGSGVTQISAGTFAECESLTNVTIGSNVTSIGTYAFSSCWSLESITIPNSVREIGVASFCWCDSLTTVTFDNSATSIGESAFSECESLTSVNFGDSVTAIGKSAFSKCKALMFITIPDSVISIDDSAFFSCESLTSITIGEGVTSIGEGAFSGCYKLASFFVREKNEYYSSQDGVLFNKDKTVLVKYPEGKTSTTYIIPNTVTFIGENAFNSCDYLINVTIPNTVTSIGKGAFWGCTRLKNINIPSSVTSIDEGTFFQCWSITNITIPDSITKISDKAFYNCKSLQSITIPNSVTSIGDTAFSSCYALVSIAIPNSVTSIGEGAFSSCSALASITIPNRVTIVDDYTFSHCVSLESVTIPDGVTTIGECAFSGCTSLKSITIFDAITVMGPSAFVDCTSLKDIYYNGTKEQKDAIRIEGYVLEINSATWHYFDGPCDSTCSDCNLIREASNHVFDNLCDPDCNVCGIVRTVGDHVYDNAYDPDCNECGETREVADLNTPTFVVENKTAKVGETFTVDVSIKNNSGIVGLRTYVGYDADVLELVSIAAGEYFSDTTFGPLTNNPISILWDDSLASSNNTTNGVVATLTFKVREGAEACNTEITLTYDPDEVYDYNWDNVEFAVENGTIAVIEYISGDVNSDGLVNNKDLGVLRRFLNDWDVTIDELASDVNRDGNVNNKDLGILRRYLNDWDVELK